MNAVTIPWGALLAEVVSLFLLLLGALAGLGAEISHPGLVFPGVLGTLCLILFLFASQIIPVNWAGVLLIVREALANVRKHANASTVRLAVRRRPGWVRVTLADDGRGFRPEPAVGTVRGLGLGLPAMRERARVLGGRLELRSQPGEGTRLTIDVPLPGRLADAG